MHPEELTPAATANVGWTRKKSMFFGAAVLSLSILGTACSSSGDESSLAFTEEDEASSTTVVETTTTAPQATTTLAETTTTIDTARALDLDEWRQTVSAQVPSILTTSDDDAEVLIALMCGLAETSNGESQFLDIPLAMLSEELGVTTEAVELLAATSIELDCPEHVGLTEG